MHLRRLFGNTAAFALALSLCVAASAMPKTLIPGGRTIGMKIYTQGLLVTEVEKDSPASRAGLKKGDVIARYDAAGGGKAALSAQIRDGETLTLHVTRDGRDVRLTIEPEMTADGCRLGAYVRDSIAGIGTVSFYDPSSGTFGALGHGVSADAASELLPVSKGEVVPSDVASVVKGVSGRAGQLKGEFRAECRLGSIDSNTPCGVFGTMTAPAEAAVPVAAADEVKVGAAVIRANVSGTEVRQYAVEILKLYDSDEDGGRNMLLKVVDPTLLSVTGGIVQGMSGSPILQDGKLVGAVTHVLVNSPNMGYGIFMENMLSSAEQEAVGSAA